eukprot:2541406-Pyramimonas_sp.AAC.1
MFINHYASWLAGSMEEGERRADRRPRSHVPLDVAGAQHGQRPPRQVHVSEPARRQRASPERGLEASAAHAVAGGGRVPAVLHSARARLRPDLQRHMAAEGRVERERGLPLPPGQCCGTGRIRAVVGVHLLCVMLE